MSYYDISDNPLSNQELDVEPGGMVEFPFKAECFAGKRLRASPVPDLTIEGRFAGDVLFADLVSVGLDVSDYDGEVATFEIRITAGNVGYRVESVELAVKS